MVCRMVAILPLLSGSCTGELPQDSPANRVDGSELVGIGATIATRSESDEDNGSSNSNSGDLFGIDTLAAYTLSLGSGTILHVSQQTGSQTPFWNDNVTYSYQYIDDYQYDGDDAWMDDNCYNYTPYLQDTPLEWSKIYALGTYAGGYAMFCMFFPLEDAVQRRNNADGSITYYVQEDQSTLDNLKRSDILAAYHSTPAIFSRIKFRLFHLMSYLRIRLYVPVYRADLNTGYRDGALNYATLTNVTPHFTIEWSIINSGDTEAPVVAGLTEESLRKKLGEETPLSSSITMYQHPRPDGATEYPKIKIKYKDFLPKNYYDQGLGEEEYDEVRIYDFSVIIPVQEKKTRIVDGQSEEVDFTDTDFLNFYLRTNAGAETRYYFNRAFKGQGSPDYGSDEDHGNGDNSNSNNKEANRFDITQGRFQYLQLYVPRVGNEVLYVGAHVNPWGKKGSGMLLQPSDQQN